MPKIAPCTAWVARAVYLFRTVKKLSKVTNTKVLNERQSDPLVLGTSWSFKNGGPSQRKFEAPSLARHLVVHFSFTIFDSVAKWNHKVFVFSLIRHAILWKMITLGSIFSSLLQKIQPWMPHHCGATYKLSLELSWLLSGH